MAEHTPPQVREAASACGAARGGLSRRQLVRAGLSAGTVAATLKSNTVLANGTVCIMASAFSSLDANPLTSQVLTQVGGACIDSQSWTTRTTARVTSDFKLNTKVNDLGFTLPYPGVDSSAWGNVTIAAALVYAGADSKFNQLLRSTLAAYLTAYDRQNGPNGDVVLTTTQCLTIWNNSGVWTEPNGIAFDLDKTLRYFAKIGVV